jgi:hypothetical protein
MTPSVLKISRVRFAVTIHDNFDHFGNRFQVISFRRCDLHVYGCSSDEKWNERLNCNLKFEILSLDGFKVRMNISSCRPLDQIPPLIRQGGPGLVAPRLILLQGQLSTGQLSQRRWKRFIIWKRKRCDFGVFGHFG